MGSSRGSGRVPVRTCVVCRRRFGKDELVRYAADAQGRVVADPDGRLPGRGVYCCRGRACMDGFFRKPERIARALRRRVRLDF